MASAQKHSNNKFEDLAEELVCRIFSWCSPVDELRAAASCKYLQTVYQKYSKDLASRSVNFDASRDQKLTLFKENTRQLLLELTVNRFLAGAPGTYRCLQSCIDKSEKDWAAHLSNIQELGFVQETTSGISREPRKNREDCARAAGFPASTHPYVQQLLQLLPSLKTLWLGSDEASQQFLACNRLQAQSTLCRASLVMGGIENELQTLPALLPNLDTLCLEPGAAMDASYLQPLSQLCRLEFLSLHLAFEQCTIPDICQIQSLRHLKLEGSSIDMLSISGFLRLQQLSLFNMSVANPQALTQLNVTSLTLHSVQLCQQWRWVQRNAVLQYPARPCWPKLKRLYLGGTVSQQLLQHMRLPNPQDNGLEVKLRRCTFDEFATEFKERLQPGWVGGDIRTIPSCVDFTFKADATPVVGIKFITAARAASVQVEGRFVLEAVEQLQEANVPISTLYIDCREEHANFWPGFTFPSLKELGLESFSLDSDGWCNWLTKCPLLADLAFDVRGKPAGVAADVRAAANRLGLTVQHTSYLKTKSIWCMVHLQR